MVAIKTVNGVEPCMEPDSDGYKITKSDLYSDNSTRSAESGTAILYLIRQNVYKIELKYTGTGAEINALDLMFSSPQLTVVFDDCGIEKSCNMYPSDRSVVPLTMRGERSYTLTLSLVEF